MTDLDAFRAETRVWLEANCPAECRGPLENDEDRVWGGRNPVFKTPAHKLWMDRMGARGWTAPEWPFEYGGGGLSREQAKVLASEMKRIEAQSPLSSFGVWMLGPALLMFGTEDQKQRFLPEIVRGEIRWCQGYSEPGAGSDLAGLQTRAEDHGDHWIVNGQKVWTSYADKADWIFCLVRTDPEASKHLGISFVLFDMATPGVTTRPIELISGKSAFCETFFDDVRVEKENLVGTLNRGWDVAKALLAHERTMIGGMGELGGGRPLGQIAADSVGADDRGRLDDTAMRARIADLDIDAAAFRLSMERVGDQVKARQVNPAIASMLKYYGSELNKRRLELVMAAGGADALEWESDRSRTGTDARAWLRTKANSIEGGTSEVQLNIIAKHLLQLRGPKLEDQRPAIILGRGLVFLAWLGSGLVALISLLIGFGSNFFSQSGWTQLFLSIPLLSGAGWLLSYRMKLKSPWIEIVALAAPVFQAICLTNVTLSGT